MPVFSYRIKNIILSAALLFFAVNALFAQQSSLRKQGNATQLIVHGKPFLVLGGELGNSSAASSQDIDRIFPKLERMGLNTVLVPAYWDIIEPEEGKFDLTLTEHAIRQARIHHLKIIFLWFGAWKNSMSCYAPLWLKKEYETYPRAYTKQGKPLEIVSAFSEKVNEADSRAFSRWLSHIATIDKEEGTVIMIQIENEIGMLENARDYSPEANEAFLAPVPSKLIDYLQKNKPYLHPQMKEKWGKHGYKTSGSWQDVFGDDLYTDEIFMAWHYALYVEKLAQKARSIYNIPLFVNAAMNSRNRKPGEYPSAGPLAHLIDIWHCGAPHIDILAPDLYDDGFINWVNQYHLHNNPLFIPEIRMNENNGVRAFYIFGEHDAIGISPFSIEDASDTPTSSLVKSYTTLSSLIPLLTNYQGKGTMKGLLFDQTNKERILQNDDLTITCRHYFTLPWDARATDGSLWPEGGGILLKLAKDEYIVAGSGIVIEFAKTAEKEEEQISRILGEDGFIQAGNDADQSQTSSSQKQTRWKTARCGIGTVTQVTVDEDGTLKPVRRLNGDQTHQGRHVRIPVGEFSILHVKLYEYR